MPFKKLHSHLLEALERFSINTPNSFQKSSIPVIKSGANVFCTAAKDSGKTTTLILTTLHKLNCEAVGNAPRAVVIVENKSNVLALYDTFLKYTKYCSLRVYASYEELHIDVQKSEIYLGIDILITTPKTFFKLLLSNGASISELKICTIDDADFLKHQSAYAALTTTAQSIKKCQFVVFSEEFHPWLKRLENHFMGHAKLVQK